MSKEGSHHYVTGHKPETKVGRPILHVKKKTAPSDKLQKLANTVNEKYGHKPNK